MLTLIWPCIFVLLIVVKVILYLQVRWDRCALGRIWCIYVNNILSYFLIVLFFNELFTIHSVNAKRSLWNHGGPHESNLLIQLFHAQRNAYMLLDLLCSNYIIKQLDCRKVHVD